MKPISTPTHGYRPDIDGLRAVAVLAVLFYHANFAGFTGGYVGVDIFFVLSGYLITTIILRGIQKNTFSLAYFYEKRIRRIFPAFYALLPFVLLGAFWLYTPEKFIGVTKSALAAIGFVSNMLFWSESGYFDTEATLKPLLHTWSLAVEEQFYLVYPWFLVLIWRYARRHFRIIYLLALLTSFSLSIYTLPRDPSATFYFFHTRAWELMLGGALALGYLPFPRHERARALLSWAGLGMITGSILCFEHSTPFPGLSALLPTAGTVFILQAYRASHQPLVNRLLSYPPLVFIGKVSYSLYLWHWPLLLFARAYQLRDLTFAESSFVLLIAFAISTISWRWIENPFRKSGFLTRKQVFQAGGATMLIFAAISGGAWLQTARWVTENPSPYVVYRCIEGNPRAIKGASLAVCAVGDETAHPQFAIWGDSHAAAITPAFDEAAKKLGIAGVLLPESGCPPLVGIERPNLACAEHAERTLRYLKNHPEIKTIFLVSRWRGYEATLYDANEEIPASAPYAQYLEIGLRRSIEALQALGIDVVLVYPVPEARYNVPEAWHIAQRTNRDVNTLVAYSYTEHQQNNRVVHQVLQRLVSSYQLATMDPAEMLCNSSLCPVADPFPLYADTNHLSLPGAQQLAPLTIPYLLSGAP